MGVGEGGTGGGAWPLLDFEIISKKGCFFNFEGLKPNFTNLSPPENILRKSPTGPPWKKSFRRP